MSGARLAGQGSSYLAYKATGDKNIANIANIVGSTVVGSKLARSGKTQQFNNIGIKSAGDIKAEPDINTSKVLLLTNWKVKKVIEKHGISVENFSKLLNPKRTLTAKEHELVIAVRKDIGLPKIGTTMSKIIPQSDIYKYLYAPEYNSVRGFVSVDKHSNMLKTLQEVYEGNRLDYNNTLFKTQNGVDGISLSVSKSDEFYGKITYTLKKAKTVHIPTEKPIESNQPYTGRGFTGSKNIVLPELIQKSREFRNGDKLSIISSKNGKKIFTFLYDKKMNSWILKE